MKLMYFNRAIAVSCPKLFMKIDNPSVMGCYITFIWLYSIATRIPTTIGVSYHLLYFEIKFCVLSFTQDE